MLVSSWSDLVEKFPELEKKIEEPHVAALREYLESGGIIRVEERNKRLVLTYPSRRMIEERIKELRRERDFYAAQLAKLRRLCRELSPIRLAFDTLFIKHQMKMLADRKYREAFSKLGFTWEHFLDPKTRKIIKAFMENPDYRARVLDAIENSPVYRKRKFGTPITEIKKSTVRTVVSKKIEAVRKKIAKIDRQIVILTLLKRWT